MVLMTACAPELPIDDRPCPCATGWSCCEGAQVCVREGASCPMPECKPKGCAELGLTCGDGDDGCGGRTVCGVCQGDGGPEPRVDAGPADPMWIRPAAPSIGPLGVVRFTSNQWVSWSVRGGVESGVITDDGLYVAPSAPGTYTVRAANQSNLDEVVDVAVTVEAFDAGLEFAAGWVGGEGFADDEGGAARFGVGAVVSRAGTSLWVADPYNNALRVFDARTGVTSTALAGLTPVGWFRASFPTAVAAEADERVVFGGVNQGVVRFDRATGTTTVLVPPDAGWSFGSFPPARLALDDAGVVFAAHPLGRRVSSYDTRTHVAATFGNLASDAGTGDGALTEVGFGRVTGLVLRPDRKAWVSEATSEVGHRARLREVDFARGTVRTLIDLPTDPVDLAGDPIGGGAFVLHNAGVWRWVPGRTELEAYAGSHPSLSGSSADGLGVSARFWGTTSLAVEPSGRLWVMENGATLRTISPGTRVVTTVAGARPAPTDLVTRLGLRQFRTVEGGVVADPARSRVYFSSGDTLWSSAPAKGSDPRLVNSLSRVAGGNALGGDATVGSQAGLSGLVDLTWSPSGAVFALEPTAVRRIGVGETFVPVSTTAGTRFSAGYVDGDRTTARFFAPKAITWLPGERLLVSETQRHTLREVSIATGEVRTVVGVDLAPTACKDGVGASARIGDVVDLTTTDTGLVYFADWCGIRTLDPTTWAVTTVGQRYGIGGLSIERDGQLVVLDPSARSLLRFDPVARTFTTLLAGTDRRALVLGKLPGAGFNKPLAIAAHPDGTLYVTDEAEKALVRVLGL